MKSLPKNLRLDHGYLQARIMFQGRIITKNFGVDDALSREIAQEWVVEKRKEIRNQKFGIAQELPKKKFEEVARLYLTLWTSERDANGQFKHTAVAIRNQTWRVERILIPSFGKMWYQDIKALDVLKWRENRVRTVEGTTANKEQIALSSIYSHIKNWILLEKIPSFQIPTENFCQGVEMAMNRKRTRILSTSELSRLHEACILNKDLDMWGIIKLALQSMLRTKDLRNLELGLIDTVQAKTGRAIQLPVNVDKALNFVNFRKRWEMVRKSANLLDVQFRDLRKTSATLLKMKSHSNKLISEFLGHSNTRTTEIYLIPNADHLKPLAQDLTNIIDSL